MFFDFGAGEIVGLALLAMILLGPDKLPQFAVDAAKFVKKMRAFATTATNELKENLGPGFEDLQPSDLRPKAFIQKHISSVLDDEDERSQKASAKIDPDLL
ncbi:MAG: sec-independent translocase [Actinobacteria bacterium]|jgi:sec-independent protein translocase protein TatB|nr:sec-independent translocase [Actinomycetota bacterium]